MSFFRRKRNTDSSESSELLPAGNNNFVFITQNVIAIYTAMANTLFGKRLSDIQLLYATALCDLYYYFFDGQIETKQIEDAAINAKIGTVGLNFVSKHLYGITDFIDNKEVKVLSMNIIALVMWAEGTAGLFGIPMSDADYVDAVISNKDIIEKAVSSCIEHPERLSIYSQVVHNISNWTMDSAFQRLVLSCEY